MTQGSDRRELGRSSENPDNRVAIRAATLEDSKLIETAQGIHGENFILNQNRDLHSDCPRIELHHAGQPRTEFPELRIAQCSVTTMQSMSLRLGLKLCRVTEPYR